jgi:hypothetical protein
VLFLMRPQGPVDECPTAFPERVVVLIENGSPHRASTERS